LWRICPNSPTFGRYYRQKLPFFGRYFSDRSADVATRRKDRTKGGRKWLFYWVLTALVDAGGQESKQAVIHRVLPRIESELVEDDREHVATGETRIENSIAWAR